MSKFAGMAGMRVGYGVFPTAADALSMAVVPPASTTCLSRRTAAAIASLEDLAYLNGIVARINADREALADNLREIPGVEPLPTATNFILVRLPVEDAGPVDQSELAERGIFVRNSPAVPRYRAIASASPSARPRRMRSSSTSLTSPSARSGCRMSQNVVAQPAVHRIREAEIERETLETRIALALDIDGRGAVSAQDRCPRFSTT